MRPSSNRSKKNIIAASLVLAMTIPSAAQASANVALQANEITQQTDTSMQVANGQLIPVRIVAETLGAELKWNATNKAVTITKGTSQIVLTIGKSVAIVDGKQVQSGQVLLDKNGNMIAALSFINEALGSSVTWNADQQSVIFGENDYAGRASSFVYQLFNSHHAKLVTTLNEQLKKSLPAQALNAISQQYPLVYGAPSKQLSAAIENNDVHTNVVMVYETDKTPLAITVRFDKAGLIDDLYFEMAAPAGQYAKPSYDKSNYTEKQVVVGEGEFALPGTLTVPAGEGPFPVVVLVQGSGPHDRDSTIGGTKVFKDIAAGLAAQNIAVLRYEKISREHTFKLSSQPTFSVKNESADDALRAVALLKKADKIDSSRIFVAGHSQGGYVMPIIIDNDLNNDIAGAILLSAPSENITTVLVEQQNEGLDRMKKLGLPAEMIASQEQAAEAWTSIVELIHNPDYSAEKLPANFPVPPAYWWYEQRDYEPAAAAQKQTKPLLILQGENDWQVSMKQLEGWKKALQAKPEVKFVSYPNVNHLLTEYEGLSIGMEYNTAAHVSASIINDMATWMNSKK
ncbi:stalk domain-containing protein [Paenibacillus luteus]|uniref:alpha/beta hydrolase family protein n=1 Tax=Paenibacillus luteus TaxID=2545753 RepID=UPI001145091D|nr:stalk domain-containing protein [Paenibacillus luteus]